MNTFLKHTSLFILCLFHNQYSYGQATSLPLIQIDALQYEGAFTIPDDTYGDSSANYTSGAIAYNGINNSIFIAGFNLNGAVAEFSIPTIVNSTNLLDLNSASIYQNFKNILSNINNPQTINRITGLYYTDNKLIINGMEFYDADANNTHTTLVLENASNLETSTVNGFYELDGAAHASGWISQIPTEWQTLLNGSHISGNSSKHPINSRLPMGVSAFSFNINDATNPTNNQIPSTTLMDFDLTNPLYADYNNYEDGNYNVIEVNGSTEAGHTAQDADIIIGTNTLWTEISQASYGFIVPGTRTYLTIGASGGHNSGIGYKPTASDGMECPGPCAYDTLDNYNYYWLWDVNDLLAVKNGTLQQHDVRPYDYGIFNVPFQSDYYTNTTPDFNEILGGTHDANSNLLYLTIYDGASTGAYDKVPVIVAYSINLSTLSIDEANTDVTVTISPNPSNNLLNFTSNRNDFKSLTIFNSLGQLIKVSETKQTDISNLNNGIYYVTFFFKDGTTNSNKFIKN